MTLLQYRFRDNMEITIELQPQSMYLSTNQIIASKVGSMKCADFHKGRVIFPLRAVEANDIFDRIGLESDIDLQCGTIKGHEYLIVSNRHTWELLLRTLPKCTFDHWFDAQVSRLEAFGV